MNFFKELYIVFLEKPIILFGLIVFGMIVAGVMMLATTKADISHHPVEVTTAVGLLLVAFCTLVMGKERGI